MNKAPARPLTLRDGMVIVAAFAAAFWVCRLFHGLHFDPMVIIRVGLGARFVINLSSTYPALVVSTLAILTLRMLPPRPRGLRLRRQPGWIASVAVVLMVVIQAVSLWSQVPIDLRSSFDLYQFLSWVCMPSSIAVGVAIAWSVQWIVGAWRPEPSWIDRLGRGMGGLWLVYYVAILVIRHFGWDR